MKKVLKILLIILIVLLLLVGGYVIYLLVGYERVEDNLRLEITQNAQGELPQGDEITITSWNIGFAAYNSDFSFFMDGGKQGRAKSEEAVHENMQYVVDFIAGQDADLMLFQEVDTDSTRSYHVNEAALIEDAFKESFSWEFAKNFDSGYFLVPICEPHGKSKSGILTLSNACIDSATRYSLPVEGGIRKFFDLDRCYTVNRIPVEGGRTLCLYNLHFSAYTSDGSIATQQLQILIDDMQAEYNAGNYVIAGGDFNKDVWGDSGAIMGVSGEDYSWAKPFPTELLPEAFTLVDSLDKEHPVASCRNTAEAYVKGETYEVTLDAFIVSDNVDVRGCRVLDTGFCCTDHNPIKMEFVLK